ncbi:rCG22485 [Rattus norvegicus]|uniref:RCG22485 n=1 Tax=Rattus norvegicus TaxID=10116 RepID=A6INY1_RAT|nr:rCG22485 [Rattus norvegicus]
MLPCSTFPTDLEYLNKGPHLSSTNTLLTATTSRPQTPSCFS